MILELELIPAYVPPPGEFLKMELEARGWTQKDLAEIIHKPQQAISEMVINFIWPVNRFRKPR